MKRRISFVLALTMILSLGLVGGGYPCAQADLPEEEVFAGTWIGMGDVHVLDWDVYPIGEYLDSAYFHVLMDLQEDGSFRFELDFEPAIPALRQAMASFCEKVASEGGFTVAEAARESDMSLEEMYDWLLDELFFKMLNLNDPKGSYRVEDGEVIFDSVIDGERYPDVSRGIRDGDRLLVDLGRLGLVAFSRASLTGVWRGGPDAWVSLHPKTEEDWGEIAPSSILEFRSDGTFALYADSADPIPGALPLLTERMEDQLLTQFGISPEMLEAATGKTPEDIARELAERQDTEGAYGELTGFLFWEEGPEPRVTAIRKLTDPETCAFGPVELTPERQYELNAALTPFLDYWNESFLKPESLTEESLTAFAVFYAVDRERDQTMSHENGEESLPWEELNRIISRWFDLTVDYQDGTAVSDSGLEYRCEGGRVYYPAFGGVYPLFVSAENAFQLTDGVILIRFRQYVYYPETESEIRYDEMLHMDVGTAEAYVASGLLGFVRSGTILVAPRDPQESGTEEIQVLQLQFD
ncbi:MAG: hypothetical protein IKH34_01115 [Oscillospiraceae bacterium]|nr:hypothetical protein [Oscillospiraceae bacterium]